MPLLVSSVLLLSGAVLYLAWAFAGGPGGLAYLALFALTALPGIPLGLAAFGRRHAAGWTTGAALGYGLTANLLAVLIFLGLRSGWIFLLAWLGLTAVIWLLLADRRQPYVTLATWTRRDTVALILMLLLVPALLGRPFGRVGAQDATGTKYYRAYFTADFLWHGALTQELARLQIPPSNPYVADRTLHYYWTYFLLPATVLGVTDGAIVEGFEPALKINALCTGVIFLALIFLVTWCAVPNAWAAALAVALGVLAPSAEGAYALRDLYERGRSLSGVRDLNIDAITKWFFEGLTIDGLPRSMWYNPQHSMAVALGLVGLLVGGAGGAGASTGAILVAGLALAAAVTVSPLPGGILALVYALAVVIDSVVKRRNVLRDVSRHALAAVPFVAAILWCAYTSVLEGAGSGLHVGFVGPARHAPVATLLLSLGPLLVPAALGLWPFRGMGAAFRPALIGIGVSLALFYLVSFAKQDAYFVGFRAGQILLVLLPTLAAHFFRKWVPFGRRSLPIVALTVALFAVGLPTTVIDFYNAQDIGNRSMGPGFRWTIALPPDEQAALSWIRRATPVNAIVQADPNVRGRETWTFIPTFAGRRMAAGRPISLLWTDEYEQKSNAVHAMYVASAPEEAWQIARTLRIAYIYVGRAEREAIPPPQLEKFDDGRYFSPLYRGGEAAVYGVVKK